MQGTQEDIRREAPTSKIAVFILTEFVTYATAFFLVVGAYYILDERGMRETTGVLTRIESVEVDLGWGRSEVRNIMFVAYTIDGEHYERPWSGHGHSGMVGQQVRFFYNLADPLRIRRGEDPFASIAPILIGVISLLFSFTGLVFFVGFKGLEERWAEMECPRLPYAIKAFEMGGACLACWQWLSPVTNISMMLMGVLIAGAGTVVNYDPMLLSKFAPERTVFAQLVSIKEAGGQCTLLFQDKHGKFYSLLTSGIPNLEENSTYSLTVKGVKVRRFVPLSARRLD